MPSRWTHSRFTFFTSSTRRFIAAPGQDVCKAALFKNSEKIVAGELVFGERGAGQTTKKSGSLTGIAECFLMSISQGAKGGRVETARQWRHWTLSRQAASLRVSAPCAV